jgi:copper homeostasis protein
MKVEVVVYNIESALKALEGGADRVEVCADPGAGGTTPSPGVVEVIRKNVSIDVYAMIRPRGGDFFYSSYEFHAMKRDLYHFQRLSVDGVVVGMLNEDGTIDKKRCTEFIQRARPLKVTCHRAFDRTVDPFQALEDCIEVGFDRILTSGQRNTALEGASLLAALQQKANGRIVIMAGSGVNEKTVGEMVRISGVNEIHFSATTYRKSTMRYINDGVSAMGSGPEHEFEVRTVDSAKISLIRNLAIAARNG